MTLKFGMEQDAQFLGHASHLPLELSTTNPVPMQMPLVSTWVHRPFKFACPAPHTRQSPLVGPVQVLQSALHEAQPPLACGKLPSGHVAAPEVEATHSVESVVLVVNPARH